MKLLEQARELLNYVKIVVDADRGDFLRDGDLILFLEAVIPVLQEHEKRQELIRAFNESKQPQSPIVFYPDERAERRTLAIFEQACLLFVNIAEDIPNDVAIASCVRNAYAILSEVEKRG